MEWDINTSEMDNNAAAAGWKFNPGMDQWEPAADYGSDNLDFQLGEDDSVPGRDYDGYEIPIKVSETMPEVTDINFSSPHYSEKSDVSFTQADNNNVSFYKRQEDGDDADFQGDESEDDSEGNPKTLMRVLTRFADRTSMQGVPYINVSKVWYAKAGWALLFLVGFIAMCLHLYYLIQEFYAFKTHSVVTLGFNTLAFPAVTVCNVNPIKHSQMDLASDALKSLVDSVQPSRIVSSMEERRLEEQGQQQNTGGTDPNVQQPPDDQGEAAPEQQNQNTNNNDDQNTNQQPPTDDVTSQTSGSSESGGSSSTTSANIDNNTDDNNNNNNQATTTHAGQSSNQNTQPPSSNQQGQSSDNDNEGTTASNQQGQSSDDNTKGTTASNQQGQSSDDDNEGTTASNQQGQSSDDNTKGTTASNQQGQSSDNDNEGTTASNQQGQSSDDNTKGTTASNQQGQSSDDNTKGTTAEKVSGANTKTTVASSALATENVASGSSTDSSAVATEASSSNDAQSNGNNSSQGVTRSPSGNGTNGQTGNDTATNAPNGSSGNRPPGPQSGSGSNSGSERRRRAALAREGDTLIRRRRFVEGFTISETNTRYQNDAEDATSTYTGNKSTLRAIEDEFKFLFTSMRSDVREQMGHQIKDMLMECTFRGIECGVQNFKLIQTADYGNCFTIENENFVSVLGGPGDGMTLIFFLQDEEYLKGIANSLGFQIQIHDRGSMANPYEEGLSASAGSETFIGLKQVNIERLGDPYGTCKEGDDFEANYGFVYSQKTCQQFCIQNFILQRCRCFDTEREEVFRRIERYQSMNVTQPCLSSDENSCLNKVYSQVQIGKLSCDCPSPCEETLFTKSLSSKTWPTADYATILVEYLCGVLNETECAVYASKSRSDLASSFLKLVIYFEDLNYENITEEENYELFQFVSDIGGTIGLWIGLSLISFFEVLQFLYELIHYLLYVKPRQKRKLARRKRQRQQQQAVRHAIRFANDISSNQTTSALQTANSKLSRPRSIKDRYLERRQRDQVFKNSQSPNGSTSSHGDLHSSSLRPPPFEDVMKNELHLDLKAESAPNGWQPGSRSPYLGRHTDNRNDLRY